MATATESDKPNIEERYTGATSASNLRVETDHTRSGPADLLIAAGMSASRLGASMLRLHSEWDGSSKPKKPTREQIETVAATLKRADFPVNLKGRALEAAVKADQRSRMVRASAEAHGWHEQELRALVGRLKSLVEVRLDLARKAYAWKIPEPWDVAAEVVKYWLDQSCPSCDGLKFRQIPGTPSLSNRVCPSCQGSGLARVPHGGDGKKLANYLDDCVAIARRDISTKLYGMRKKSTEIVAKG
jgi:hypothetical protein